MDEDPKIRADRIKEFLDETDKEEFAMAWACHVGHAVSVRFSTGHWILLWCSDCETVLHYTRFTSPEDREWLRRAAWVGGWWKSGPVEEWK
jgi:hypothetical protein